MKRILITILVLAASVLVCVIGGMVDEYMRPYRKIVIRCDAGRSG